MRTPTPLKASLVMNESLPLCDVALCVTGKLVDTLQLACPPAAIVDDMINIPPLYKEEQKFKIK